MDLGLVAERYDFLSVETQRVSRTWRPVWGTQAEYPENYEGRVVRLVTRGSTRLFAEIELRVCDEGVAVRAARDFSPYGLASLRTEAIRWRFPKGTKAWCTIGEATYPKAPCGLDTLDPGRVWGLPFTVELPDGGCASLLEADVRDWPSMLLRRDGDGLKPEFAAGAMEGRDWRRSPWRVVLVASDAAELVAHAALVETLNAPPEGDFSWVKPGFCVSDIKNCRLKTDEVIAAAREAKAAGARYVQLDWGWYGTEAPWTKAQCDDFERRHPQLAKHFADGAWRENAKADPTKTARGFVPYSSCWGFDCHRFDVDLDIPGIVKALRALDMGLALYVNGTVLETCDVDRLFALYESWGVAGLKPGFVSCGSQRSSEWLREMIRLAAKHRLWLDIHDGFVPDGVQRTFPNLMICEGGGGQEGHHPLRQDVSLPFGRCLAGPFDYTPEFFEAHRTHAHAAAMLLVYPGPTATMRGSLKKARAADPGLFDFVRALPWNYDETKVLSAKIGDHLVVARRKGKDWYVAGITGESGREFSLPLTFLGPGEWQHRLWQDGSTDAVPASVARQALSTVSPVDSLRALCAPGGGFCAVFRFLRSH